MTSRYLKALVSVILVLMVTGSASAQSDPIGTVDVVYVDSVEAGPGQDVPVKFFVRNDETLGSLSLPITYDPTLISLKAISFSDSRVEYISTKMINPEEIANTNGHFAVAVIRFIEDPIPVGDGVVFTALFRVSDSASPGTIAVIDTLSYPPSGELMLVESPNSTILRPAFVAGQVVVGGPNQGPIFAEVQKQYVLEGDTLKLDIKVNDPDSGSLTIAATSKPSGAMFETNGDGSGRLVWVPDFIGPNSADGSPFTVDFWASDGDLSVQQQAEIEVINRNRTPMIDAPEEVVLDAGGQLDILVAASDPDFEPISWTWSSSLDGATFDMGNPGHFNWTSTLTDTGSSVVEFVATDPHGFSDTAQVQVTVNAVPIYVLRMDTVVAFPGDEVEFYIYMDNMLPVTGFNILFHYDPSALTILDLTKAGTRIESFEYFAVTYNENSVTGNVRVLGIADQGGGTPGLDAGEGSVVSLRLRVVGDVALAGRSVPVWFRFLDGSVKEDNTLSDSLGVRIEQEDILYVNGRVRIAEIGDINIGDINLNGLAAEIADVILFTNYFINPMECNFNALQYANSDINHDNIVATVSDLVALINLVTGNTAGKFEAAGNPQATLSTRTVNGRTHFSYETNFEVGGIYLSLESGPNTSFTSIDNPNSQMDLGYTNDGQITRVILYSLDGGVMSAGVHEAFSIEELHNYSITAIDMATLDGRYVSVAREQAGATVPGDYVLHQNYPNPFNPETTIEFDLPRASGIQVRIFNVLGREVKTLVSEELPAGVHAVTWNGTDNAGQTVASGIYMYRLEAENVSLTRKMMLLK